MNCVFTSVSSSFDVSVGAGSGGRRLSSPISVSMPVQQTCGSVSPALPHNIFSNGGDRWSGAGSVWVCVAGRKSRCWSGCRGTSRTRPGLCGDACRRLLYACLLKLLSGWIAASILSMVAVKEWRFRLRCSKVAPGCRSPEAFQRFRGRDGLAGYVQRLEARSIKQEQTGGKCDCDNDRHDDKDSEDDQAVFEQGEALASKDTQASHQPPVYLSSPGNPGAF